MPTAFYPQHDQPTNEVHQSFLAQDGAPIERLTPLIEAQLTSIVTLLRDPHSNSDESMQYWQSTEWFEAAAYLLLAYFGVEDHTCEIRTMNDDQDYWGRFQVDSRDVMRLLGLSWPAWGEWTEALKDAEVDLKARCHQMGGVAPDWGYIWWRQGVAIKEHHGYRLRPILEQRGQTHFDKCIQFIESKPTWITLLEQWAATLARSEFLSMLMTNGDLSREGILVRREAVELQQSEIRSYFKIDEVCQLVSAALISLQKVYTTFRRELWPIILQPLLRRAHALHTELSAIGQQGGYYQSPVSTSSSPTQSSS
jgi:hypothetical protein